LLMAICVPPVLWASKKILGDELLSFDYAVLGISLVKESQFMILLAYLAGISAASGIIIVSTLALASMSLNHLLLPITRTPTTGYYLYQWLQWQRYFLIATIIAFAYA